MITVTPLSGITHLFHQIHFPEMVRNLGGISPQDLGLALKRIALKRRPKGIPTTNSGFYEIRDLLSPEEQAILQTIRSCVN